MKLSRLLFPGLGLAFLFLFLNHGLWGSSQETPAVAPFPVPLSAYTGEESLPLSGILRHRVEVEPLNLVSTIIFFLAVVHTFLAARFTEAAHRLKERHEEKVEKGEADGSSFWAEVLHFLGEVEAIFGIWAIPLFVVITGSKGWLTADSYIGHVNFTEPMFVVVIMAISSTRPVLAVAERFMGGLAALGKGTPLAWWMTILTIGPLLGSFITEPAAMVISALLLARRIFELKPGVPFRYATLGLLFVSVSIGGTLTHFAAPPVLMVAAKFKWNLGFMFTHFGWKAGISILLSTITYAVFFRKEFALLASRAKEKKQEGVRSSERGIPVWVTTVHLLALVWTVFTAHTPALFVAGFLFFLAFTHASSDFQNPMNLRSPLLVGFFLAGLVVHGTLQQWWIAPVLARLDSVALMLGATFLTAFNDNAAITYLASLVPGLSPALKYAVVAGAVTGGGLTVIANAPNPAGQSILGKYFPDGVAPLWLALAALLPTIIAGFSFMLL